MILSVAILVGLPAVCLRSIWTKRPLRMPALRGAWCVCLACLAQYLAFFMPSAYKLVSDRLASICLMASLLLLLGFVGLNWKLPAFWALGLGLLLNLVVILLNRGFMPISPQVAQQLMPGVPAAAFEIGHRIAASKDIILPIEAMRLGFLSDRFLLPTWIHYRAAFSLGDCFIAGGAFWLIWDLTKDYSNRNKNKEARPSHAGQRITNHYKGML